MLEMHNTAQHLAGCSGLALLLMVPRGLSVLRLSMLRVIFFSILAFGCPV